MPWNQRVRTRLKNAFLPHQHASHEEDVESGSDGGEESSGGERCKIQYRLEATRKVESKQSLLKRILTCNGCLSAARRRNVGLSVGANPNQALAYYLHWMFRVNFLFLFVVMCVAFFALVILFSGFITLAGNMDEDCVRIGGEPFGSAGAKFADAFSLSWTTFSTVGYGSTYSALGYENNSPTNCFFINFICSLEALLGVLYSGFCGAILFGKVLRIQSHAQVIFSDPIVIRYGKGVVMPGSEEQIPGNESSDEESPGKLPCPVLEFRIVNRLYSEPGGEIMDASLNVVANIDADDAALGFPGAPQTGATNSESVSMDDEASSTTSYEGGSSVRSMSQLLGPLGAVLRRDNQQALDEDPSHRLVNKMIFSKVSLVLVSRDQYRRYKYQSIAVEKNFSQPHSFCVLMSLFPQMMIEAADHPFFKRVWLARHVLDEYSPILKPKVRRMIKRNGGHWPEKLNSYIGVRESLQFNQILVSLNGVSNISASDAYAQKI